MNRIVDTMTANRLMLNTLLSKCKNAQKVSVRVRFRVKGK